MTIVDLRALYLLDYRWPVLETVFRGPHEALGMGTPSSRYTALPRPYPARVQPIDD